MRTRKILLLIVFLAIPCIRAGPARAGLWLDIDVEKTSLSYDGSGHADITLTGDADVLVNLFEDGTLRDSAQIYKKFGPGSFDAGMGLDFVKLGGEWTATGDFWLTDTTLANRVDADFRSSDIRLESAGVPGTYRLIVEGPISGPTPILVGADPWTFQGDYESSLHPANGLDGAANRVTIQSPASWTGGSLVALHYTVDASTLDDFFDSAGSGFQGDLDVTLVPVPAAFLLGLIGLSAAGVELRRFA